MDTISAAGRQLALRDYQIQLNSTVADVRAAGHRRILVALPTGGGKTTCFAETIREEVAAGRHVLVLVHRRELLIQAQRRLYAACVDAGIVAAGHTARPSVLVQIAMVQTLHARAVRSSTMSLPKADVIVVDEAHHVVAGTWAKIIAAYPDAVVLGYTATPIRGDNRGLGGMFGHLVQGPSIPALVAAGYLVGTRVFAPYVPDLQGVKVTAGDYNERQLADRLNRAELVGDLVVHWRRHANGQCTVVFAITRAHGIAIRDVFLRDGALAEYLDGTTPTEERDAILARLTSGQTEIVVNVGVLTEGWDLPGLRCIILARPTKSLGLFLQIIGRGLRPAPGKEYCTILDHSGSSLKHGLVDVDPIPWSLAPDRGIDRDFSSSKGDGTTGRKLVTCPECTAIFWSGSPCGVCGWRPRPKPKAIPVREGDLAELDRDRMTRRLDPTEAERAAWHGMLATIAAERGYAPGWVAHKFRDKFKTWPPRRPPVPLDPTPEVRSWVRSRAIAWAKAQPCHQTGAA